MRFNCVGNALSEFIPDFERVIKARRDKLFIIDRHNASHFVLMCCCRLKVTLSDDNILVDISFLIFGFVCSSLAIFVLRNGWVLGGFNHFYLASLVI